MSNDKNPEKDKSISFAPPRTPATAIKSSARKSTKNTVVIPPLPSSSSRPLSPTKTLLSNKDSANEKEKSPSPTIPESQPPQKETFLDSSAMLVSSPITGNPIQNDKPSLSPFDQEKLFILTFRPQTLEQGEYGMIFIPFSEALRRMEAVQRSNGPQYSFCIASLPTINTDPLTHLTFRKSPPNLEFLCSRGFSRTALALFDIKSTFNDIIKNLEFDNIEVMIKWGYAPPDSFNGLSLNEYLKTNLSAEDHLRFWEIYGPSLHGKHFTPKRCNLCLQVRGLLLSLRGKTELPVLEENHEAVCMRKGTQNLSEEDRRYLRRIPTGFRSYFTVGMNSVFLEADKPHSSLVPRLPDNSNPEPPTKKNKTSKDNDEPKDKVEPFVLIVE